MFGRDKDGEILELRKLLREGQERESKLEASYKIIVENLHHKYKMEKEEAQLSAKFRDNSDLAEKDAEIAKNNIQIAELKKENEMMKKIVDLNADIIDVKNLVSKLIEKLPEIKLNNLTVSTHAKNG